MSSLFSQQLSAAGTLLCSLMLYKVQRNSNIT